MSNPLDKNNNYNKARIGFLEKQISWHEYALEVLGHLTGIHGSNEDDRDFISVLKDTRKHLKQVFQFDVVAFYLVDEESTEFVLYDCLPEHKQDQIEKEFNRSIESGHFSWALNQNKLTEFPSDSLNGTLIFHVLKTRNRIRGMFVALCTDDDLPNTNESRVLTVMLANCAYALESSDLYQVMIEQQHQLEKRVQEKTLALEYEQSHDSLTTLPRFSLFKDRISQALSHNKRLKKHLAVLLIDIDKFSLFNDLLGRHGGDKLIRLIADRLKNALRDYDIVSRLGLAFGNMSISRIEGDEFCILLIDQENLDGVRLVVHRISQLFSKPFDVEGQEVFLTVSMGVGVSPDDADDADVLLNKADVALYQSKHQGGNGYQFFSKEMMERSFEHLLIDNRLHQAVDNEDFELYYQPKICSKTETIVSVEALIRWPQSDGSIVSPDAFISAAEQNGLIVPMGEWVIKVACLEIQYLMSHGKTVTIAVNLSPKQLKDPMLLDTFKRILKETKIDPTLLEVELTESSLLHDINNVIELMDNLKAFGIKISLDDFGTGYSSFSYLKRLPIDTLKIDQSFVQDIDFSQDDEAIVSAIIVMAHALNMKVVAEGVETEQQLAKLKEQNVDYIQGYYYHRPMSAKELHKLLDV